MSTVAFDALRALRSLTAHDVRFIVIGGMAASAWGSPTVTNDLDICYERSKQNHRALADALRELGATLRGAPADLPFVLDDRTIAMGDSFTFDTVAGSLDCLGTPSGTDGYRDLAKNATQVDLDDGLRVAVCAIDDLMRMKRAAGRPKDRVEIEILSAVKEEREKL
jgi:predicted nucleotidyltransferase